MNGIAWRQSRSEFLIVALVLAALAAFLVPTGLERFDEYEASGLRACVDNGQSCGELRDQLVSKYDRLSTMTGWFHLIPGIVGLVLAVPIVAEFEQRTYRLAWTQSITRSRWLVAKLAVGASGVLLFSVAFTAMHTWWFRPLDQSLTLVGKDLGQSFGFEGILPFCYTLFAFSLGTAAGVLGQKMVVAMPVALGGFIALRLSVEAIFRGLSSEAAFEAPGGQLAAEEATRDMGRFWAMQATEGLLFLGLSACLLAVTVLLVRRR